MPTNLPSAMTRESAASAAPLAGPTARAVAKVRACYSFHVRVRLPAVMMGKPESAKPPMSAKRPGTSSSRMRATSGSRAERSSAAKEPLQALFGDRLPGAW